MANVKNLKNIYKKRCMLTSIRDELSFHHIIKDENGGLNTIENGGLLYFGIHQWLHNYAELYDQKLYIEANNTIIEYKKLFEDKPYWFDQWENEVNEFYIRQCIEYYNKKHNITLVKKLEREYNKIIIS